MQHNEKTVNKYSIDRSPLERVSGELIIGATGHRPSKLPGKYSKETTKALYQTAYSALESSNPDKVISGMALGWDTAIARAANDLKIPLIAAVPFVGQESRWHQKSKNEYYGILCKAEIVRVISSGGYSAKAMQARNEWIVDNSDRVLTLWDGKKQGGTWNCIEYISKQDAVDYTNLWDSFLTKTNH